MSSSPPSSPPSSAAPAKSTRLQAAAEAQRALAATAAAAAAAAVQQVPAPGGPASGLQPAPTMEQVFALLAAQGQRHELFLQAQLAQLASDSAARAADTEVSKARADAGPTPLFNGKGHGLEAHRWLADLELWFEAAQMGLEGDSRWIEVATHALRDTAREWWRTKVTDGTAAGVGTWILFKKTLCLRFLPVDTDTWAYGKREALLNGKHRDVVEYTAKFLELNELIPDEGPKGRIHAYQRGLPADYAEKCAAGRHTALASATEAMISRWHTKESARRATAAVSSLHSTEASAPSPASSTASAPSAKACDPVDELRAQVAQLTAMFAGSFRPQSNGSGGGGGQGTSGRSGGRPRQRDGAGAEGRERSKTPGLSDEIAFARMRAGECIKCGQKGHLKRDCTNAVKLN